MAYEINEAKDLVIRAGKELLRTGLIARTWGNISARISDTQFVITPSGRGYESLTPDEIVTVNIADCSYEGEIRPSSEKGVHAAAYRHRPEADFVIHTHQDFATDLSTLGKIFDVAAMCSGNRDNSGTSPEPGNQAEDLPAGEAVRILGHCIPTAGYGLSATKQITENVEKAITDYPGSRAVLMQNHGTLCIGNDVEDAFRIAHTLENVCRREYRRILDGGSCGGLQEKTGKVGGTGLFPKEADREEYSLSSYSRVYHREKPEEYAHWSALFEAHPDIRCIILTDAPFIRVYSRFGKPLTPYVDDLAMIVGMKIPVIGEDRQTAVSEAVTGTDSAILIRGEGAVCTAGNEEDAGAVVMILDKGCQMGLLDLAGANPIPVTEENGNYEHRFYVEQYSKRK